MQNQQQLPPKSTFSIATPAVTTIMAEDNMNETKFINSTQSVKQPDPPPNHAEPKDQIKHEGTVGLDTDQAQKSDLADPPLEEDTATDDGNPNSKKKRNKPAKKGAKLDAKSKLEKSRQSARECRARKKLRYQYLEDLVCNREKAVVKLREELSVFCEISRQIDTNTVTEASRNLLMDPPKEANKNVPTGGQMC